MKDSGTSAKTEEDTSMKSTADDNLPSDCDTSAVDNVNVCTTSDFGCRKTGCTDDSKRHDIATGRSIRDLVTMTDHNTRAALAAHPSDLLDLPAELRLQIYEHLIVDCLAHGIVTDVSGLYLACRQTHQEIELEYMGKIKPLLQARSQWQQLGFDAPLRIKVTPHFKAAGSDADISIRLCLPRSWLDKYRRATVNQTKELKNRVPRLIPVLTLNCSALALGIEYSDGDTTSLESAYVFFATFCESDNFNHNSLSELAQVDRLVLDLGNASSRVSFTHFWLLLSLFTRALRHVKHMAQSLRVHQAWISRIPHGNERGWRLTIDFTPNASMPKGALWKLGMPGDSWTSWRLFDEMEDVAAHDTDDQVELPVSLL